MRGVPAAGAGRGGEGYRALPRDGYGGEAGRGVPRSLGEGGDVTGDFKIFKMASAAAQPLTVVRCRRER